MFSSKFRTLASGCLMVVAATTLAWAQGMTVRRVPKLGEAIQYRMKGTIELGGQSLNFEMTSTEKVSKVDPSGEYTIEQSEQEVKVNDQNVPATGKPQLTVYKPSGEVSQILGSDVGGAAYRMNNLTVLIDADKPLAVGDAWTKTVKGDAKLGTVSFKADYKVLGEEQMDGIDSIKVKCAVKETEGDRPESSDGIAWISKADGSLVRLESKWTAAPIPGLPEPANATIVVTRIKPAS